METSIETTKVRELEEQKKIQDEDQALEAAEALERKEDLAGLKKDSATLEKHSKDVTVNWSDIKAHSVGNVDYAPSIETRTTTRGTSAPSSEGIEIPGQFPWECS